MQAPFVDSDGFCDVGNARVLPEIVEVRPKSIPKRADDFGRDSVSAYFFREKVLREGFDCTAARTTARSCNASAAPTAASGLKAPARAAYPAAREKTCPAPAGRGLTAQVVPRSRE
jgi:hypothetical protein